MDPVDPADEREWEIHKAFKAKDAEIVALRAEVAMFKERWELEQIRYEGISGANEELRKENKGLKEEQDRLRDQGADDARVFFYERQFYVLSNFSAFTLAWRGELFDTSEAAYHSEKFPDRPDIHRHIRDAASAHAALKLAERFKECR